MLTVTKQGLQATQFGISATDNELEISIMDIFIFVLFF